MDTSIEKIKNWGSLEYSISVEEVRLFMREMTSFTRNHLRQAGYPKKDIEAIITKLRDAGRRSPPWKPTSSLVPGLPQDGADGNRRWRWLFEPDHKFYADEVTATLVEIRYYLQILSMKNAPPLPESAFQEDFIWLTGHKIEPGIYKDPIQLVDINLQEVLKDRRLCQSGHLIPLDRGGRHETSNAFLMLARSNQLQGNMTLDELLQLMYEILERHRRLRR
jgi:hypothetical protein